MSSHATPGRVRRPTVFLLSLAGIGLLAAACGTAASGTGAGSYGAPAGPSSAAPSAPAASVTTHQTALGPVLAGPDGRTVYLFEKDKGVTSSCNGACAAAWPPVTTPATPKVTGMAQAQLLGTTHRSDGTAQVTYAGHPLYYFTGDRSATDVRGEGLKNFGAGWYVLKASGQKIDQD